ncbi:MAG: hypothetical protein KBI18_04730 [Brachymonas sp.]|nr:hypothetical protein [Brachymonas sp.]MBP8596928.1 hypothetical protein [Brachymonas sp.]MBP8747567.1 hypothetical protein [Brachymonas sp.]
MRLFALTAPSAGGNVVQCLVAAWIPACAGMTGMGQVFRLNAIAAIRSGSRNCFVKQNLGTRRDAAHEQG